MQNVSLFVQIMLSWDQIQDKIKKNKTKQNNKTKRNNLLATPFRPKPYLINSHFNNSEIQRRTKGLVSWTERSVKDKCLVTISNERQCCASGCQIYTVKWEMGFKGSWNTSQISPFSRWEAIFLNVIPNQIWQYTIIGSNQCHSQIIPSRISSCFNTWYLFHRCQPNHQLVKGDHKRAGQSFIEPE